MRPEVVVAPVADVDRAKSFYEGLGWRLDADFALSEDLRVVQLTPLGSPCSIIPGTGVGAAAPGSVQGLDLVVTDIERTRAELTRQLCRRACARTEPSAAAPRLGPALAALRT
ncbi:hypothetical protein ABZ904_46025 [Streptomyces sp. NPDC046900]|uniref:hypothetical protein n=1 Tax=Streptomyces sp. NPDC046900 TaxID=3155473 RepID=UPI0033C5BDFE